MKYEILATVTTLQIYEVDTDWQPDFSDYDEAHNFAWEFEDQIIKGGLVLQDSYQQNVEVFEVVDLDNGHLYRINEIEGN